MTAMRQAKSGSPQMRPPMPRWITGLLGLAALLVLAAGCPRDVNEPEPPPAAPCTTNAECTPEGAECGLVFVCIDGLCETTPSRRVPCER